MLLWRALSRRRLHANGAVSDSEAACRAERVVLNHKSATTYLIAAGVRGEQRCCAFCDMRRALSLQTSRRSYGSDPRPIASCIASSFSGVAGVDAGADEEVSKVSLACGALREGLAGILAVTASSEFVCSAAKLLPNICASPSSPTAPLASPELICATSA